MTPENFPPPLQDSLKEEDLNLPPEPDRPDCCNGGCAVCVLDGFAEEMRAWRNQCHAIRMAAAAARAAGGGH